MEMICLHEPAFYALIDKVVSRVLAEHSVKEEKWLSPDEAMNRLHIKSKTTLQKLRDEGRIRYSQPEKKLIVYDAASIDAFLEQHSKDTF
jgi:hypothetical protein